MAKAPFDDFFKRAIEHEGRVTEDVPGDRGGPTKWGITIGRLATSKGVKLPQRGTAKWNALKAELFALSEDEIKTFYKRDYWDAVRADELPPGVAYCVSDYGLNSGPSRAIKALQKILGNPQTGRMDDETIREAHAFDPVELIMLYQEERQRFLNAIVASRPNQRKFLKGWTTRVGDVKRAAVKMADAAPPPEPKPAPMPKAVEPEPPPAPSVVTVAVKSKTNVSIVAAAGIWITKTWTNGVEWLGNFVGNGAEVVQLVNTDVNGWLDPIVALMRTLQVNVGNVMMGAALVFALVSLARHTRDKGELERLRAMVPEADAKGA